MYRMSFYQEKSSDLSFKLGVGNTPAEKQSTAETTIFILNQQTVSHMKAVMVSSHLIPGEVPKVIGLASVTS